MRAQQRSGISRLCADSSGLVCCDRVAVLFVRVGMVHASAVAPLPGGGSRMPGGVVRSQDGQPGAAEKQILTIRWSRYMIEVNGGGYGKEESLLFARNACRHAGQQ